MIRKVRNCCETCENLVCVATTIGQLQHTEYLKPTFLDTFKWAIRPVFPETVTYNQLPSHIQQQNIFQYMHVQNNPSAQIVSLKPCRQYITRKYHLPEDIGSESQWRF